MSNPYLDNYSTTFSAFDDMMKYHAQLTKESQWRREQVSHLYATRFCD